MQFSALTSVPLKPGDVVDLELEAAQPVVGCAPDQGKANNGTAQDGGAETVTND